MTTTHHKKQNDDKSKVGSIAAGVAGAAVITGVAVAATMAMRNKKTRKKVEKVLTNTKDKVIGYVDAFKT